MIKASVVVSVNNDEKHLSDCIQSVIEQTETDIEIIVVDIASTDNSLQILRGYAEKDSRIIILNQNRHIGIEEIINIGLTSAKGKYVIFISGYTICDLGMIERTVTMAEENQADITIFDFFNEGENNNKKLEVGLNDSWLVPETTHFNYENCPDRIMSILNPYPCNKLYRTDFLKEIILNFEGDILSDEKLFNGVCAVNAGRIFYVREALMNSIIKNNTDYEIEIVNDSLIIENIVRELEKLPYYDVISKSVCIFMIENYIPLLGLDISNDDFTETEELYNFLHAFFNEENIEKLQISDLRDDRKWLLFNAVKKHNYEDMNELKSRKLIVSFTSYPARISYVPTVLESIVNQSLLADKIVLYLAKEQFPERENELPETLLEYVKKEILDIGWCDDLRPHKKYFYAMQEYPDDVIVTVDDDIIYPKDMLQRLYDSYLVYPEAVSGTRTHLITLSEDGEILPYKYWLLELDTFLFKPTLYLFATTGAGTLFPPGLLPNITFEKKVIEETCLNADDLWLKTAQLINSVPVVCASRYGGLNYVPGSQNVTLYKTNKEGGNDAQLAKIVRYFEKETNTNVWTDKLTSINSDENLSLKKNVCKLANDRYFSIRGKWSKANIEKAAVNKRLKETNIEKANISKKLSTVNAEKADINKKLIAANAEKADISKKLTETNKEKEDINRKLTEVNIEKTEISKKLAAANIENEDIRKKLKQTSKEKREMRERLKSKITKIKDNKKREKENYELQIKTLNDRLDAVEKEKQNIENSTTYKVGKIIMWIPVHIKIFLKNCERKKIFSKKKKEKKKQ